MNIEKWKQNDYLVSWQFSLIPTIQPHLPSQHVKIFIFPFADKLNSNMSNIIRNWDAGRRISKKKTQKLATSFKNEFIESFWSFRSFRFSLAAMLRVFHKLISIFLSAYLISFRLRLAFRERNESKRTEIKINLIRLLWKPDERERNNWLSRSHRSHASNSAETSFHSDQSCQPHVQTKHSKLLTISVLFNKKHLLQSFSAFLPTRLPQKAFPP